MKKFSAVFLFFLFTTPCFAQSWSGILTGTRAVDWASAGLPATLPDGETTANPWTPPVRTQCGSTLTPSGGDDTTQFTAALSACTAGHYVFLGNGTFHVNSTFRISPGYNSNKNYLGFYGSGPQSTKIVMGASGNIYIGAGAGSGSCTLTSGSNYSQNSTTITCIGSTPPTNWPAYLNQCDTGWSGSGCNTGANADNGGWWVCADQTVCSNQSASGSSHQHQQQIVTVTNVSGTCSISCVVTITPGLFTNQWAFSSSPTLTFADTTYASLGAGFQDMTIDFSAGGGFAMESAYYSWIKGVRFVGAANTLGCCGILLGSGAPLGYSLFSNNYLFMSNPVTQAGAGLPVQWGDDSGVLLLNNIWQSGGGINDIEGAGAESGNVLAFNYMRDSVNTQMYATDAEHYGGIMMELREANQMGGAKDDNTWGTHDADTMFRNNYSCNDGPFIGLPAPLAISVNDFARFANIIGNVLNGGGTCTGGYQINNNNSTPYIFGFGSSDTLTLSTSNRWGNYAICAGNTHCNVVSFDGTQMAGTLPSPNTAYSNAIPSNNNLPASFFMDSMGFHPSGGTGLSWWKVCKTWTTFPTACATTQTQPMPPIGPDVIGGSYANGFAYDVPSAVAWKNLPIDTTYQNSYTILSSAWSGGIETLTFTSGVLPSNVNHIMGGFRTSGLNSACLPSSGVSYTGRSDGELLMTGSSATTVQYAIASNPSVSCIGTMLFPDIREFDERVYENDSASGVSLSPSSQNFGSINLGSSSSPVIFTLTNNSGTTATSINPSNTGGNTGDFAIVNSGAGSCNAAGNSIAASASCTFTVTFSPSATGSRSTTLSVSYSGGDGASPRTSALSGTGSNGGAVTLSPSSNNFGSISVGSSSSPTTFTLSNGSATTATSINPITTTGNSGDFTIINSGVGSCNAAGNSIAASASCTFTVTFSPTASGSRSTTLSVSYSGGDGASPQTSALSGTGTTSSAVGTSMSGGAQVSGSVKLQ
jgi:hypothetical protein